MAAQMQQSTDKRPETITRAGICPSCGQRVMFQYNGQQVWPEHIAAAMGIPSVVSLWNCNHCHSTLSDTSLDDVG